MTLARSPAPSRSRSRVNPDRAAKGKSRQAFLQDVPAVQTPSPALGPAPPATPVGHSMHSHIEQSQISSGREASAVVQSRPQSADSSSDDFADATLIRDRGRPRGRNSTLQDPTLLKILTLLTKKIIDTPSPKPSASTAFKTPAMKAPDPYDGSTYKLRNFIQSCQLIFHNDEQMFSHDKKKVLYATSFLTGKAGKWIEPYLSQLDNEDPNYLLNSWSLFESQLFTLFGDPNEIRKAEQDLDHLRMKDQALASSYITDFRTLTTRISDWGERALMFHFRKRLPSRFLHQLAVHQAPLDSLQDLMKETLDYDICYHERSKEKKIIQGGTSSSKEKTENSNSSSTKKKKKSKNEHKDKKKSNSQASKTSKAEILNKDGTLKEEEKERRIKEGLCSYCSGKHKFEDFPKAKVKNFTSNPHSSAKPKNP